MHILLQDHFDVQKGMYFDQCSVYKNWILFLSDIIKDGFWNYAVIPDQYDLKKELPIIEKKFEQMERPASIYVVNEKDYSDTVSYLLKEDFEKMSEESFMIFQNTSFSNESLPENVTIVQATEKQIISDFVEVFTSAYGGEKSLEQPYGELDESYVEALMKSFNKPDKFYHYVCYVNSRPVSVATLCFENGKGGLYNVGTVPNERGCGYGTVVTIACIKKWKEMAGKTLFLQTETGSNVEKWYYRLGFELAFYGSIYCKEKN